MYVLGDRIAERIDLDTLALTDLSAKPWAKDLVTPVWKGGFREGPGVGWHARTKQIIVASRTTSDGGTTWSALKLTLIDPATDVFRTVEMTGLTDASNSSSDPLYGRFRVIPGTDQAVILQSVFNPVFIGTVPF